MLDALPVVTHSASVFRFANLRDDVAALIALGIDPGSVPDMLDLLGRRAAPGGMERLIDGSFEPWNAAPGPPFGEGTRFSDGTLPVCYTALDQDTAQEEIQYHRGKYFLAMGRGRVVYFHLVEMSYSGRTMDLRSHVTTWPALVDPDEGAAYPFCQTFGHEACCLSIAGFLTQSARRPIGTNLPVFSRSALDVPQTRALAAFVAHPASGAVKVEWLEGVS
jgi:RES domain